MSDVDNMYYSFPNTSELDQALALRIKAIIDQAIVERGQAAIALSGGSTPKGLYQILNGLDIDWAKVKVTLVDDRCVPEDHHASNAKLVKDNLLNNVADFQFIPLAGFINSEAIKSGSIKKEEVFDKVADQENTIDQYLKENLPILDVALLGMGLDSHTASFFPNSPQLSKALDLDSERYGLVTEPTNAEFIRVTLSLAFILKSRQLILHISGDEKLALLKSIVAAPKTVDAPVSYIVHQQHSPLDIYHTA